MGEIADALRQADQAGADRQTEPVVAPEVAPPRTRPEPTGEASDPPSKPQEPPVLEEPHTLLLAGNANEEPEAPRITLVDPQGTAAQQYRRLAFRVREIANDRNARSIVVTSAQAGDGKTTTACNLAVQLVRLDQGSRVALVDLDLHRASIARSLGIEVRISIDTVLQGGHTVGEAIIETDLPGLSILAQQQPTTDAEWLLAHPNLKATIHELENRFDFVIIDTPPILATSDAQVILRHAAAGLLVVRAGLSRVRAVRNALDHIPARKFLGSVLNSSPSKQGLYDYPYYGDPKSPDDPEPSLDEQTKAPHA